MRGKAAPKRKINPDSKYQLMEIAKFINYVMRRGKKTVATKIVYDSLENIFKKTKKDPIETFKLAIKNVSPIVEVKSRRIGGANYQIPIPTQPSRRFILASRWIIESAKSKKGKKMSEKLAEELIEASQGQGNAIKKKNDIYRMAEANKAFAHFARY